jgi:hypothetical protein
MIVRLFTSEERMRGKGRKSGGFLFRAAVLPVLPVFFSVVKNLPEQRRQANS